MSVGFTAKCFPQEMSLEDGKTCLSFIEDRGIYNPSSKGQGRRTVIASFYGISESCLEGKKKAVFMALWHHAKLTRCFDGKFRDREITGLQGRRWKQLMRI